MAVRIVHASKDEYGNYSRGTAGDQTGQEVCQRDWYNRPWDVIARPKYDYIARYTATVAAILAASPAIGYDQGEAVCTLLRENGFSGVRCVKDLAGLDRVVTGVYHV